jgi:UDP-N-acetyl-D-mannosaminuronate dehydrogenase
MISDITKRIEENSYTVGVIGLGYVGIPLALGFASKGIRVIGFDIDEGKVSSHFKACQGRLPTTNERFQKN